MHINYPLKQLVGDMGSGPAPTVALVDGACHAEIYSNTSRLIILARMTPGAKNYWRRDMELSTSSPPQDVVHGGCHCGRVRWTASVPLETPIITCNCSRCAKLAYLHLIVNKERFDLQSSEDALTEYKFNTGVARHLFCASCGVQSFYVPRSHPEGISLNARCIDGGVPVGRMYREFDGNNWEANIASIK